MKFPEISDSNESEVQSANVLRLKVLTTQLAGPPQEEDKAWELSAAFRKLVANL